MEKHSYGETPLWAGPYNHKAGSNSTFIDRVVCIRGESFQDAEKDSLRPDGEMGTVPLSNKAIYRNACLIGRH